MKKLIIPLILLMLPVFVNAQSCSMRRMFRSYDPGKEVTRIHIPSCLTTLTSWFVDEPEAKYLLKQIKSIYVLSSEDEAFSKESDFPSKIAKKLKSKNFEELMAIKSDGEQVDMLVRKKGKKNEFVIAVNGEEDAMIYIRTKGDLAELANLGKLGIKGVDLGKVMKDI